MQGRRCYPPPDVRAIRSWFWADVDERTLETAKSLLSGLAPGCAEPVHRASDDSDRLFDPLPSVGTIDRAKSRASLLGSVGGDPEALAQAYHAQFAALDHVLGCGSGASCKPVSQVPTIVTETGDGGLSQLAGGLDLASSAAENLLLEYTDGQKVVGWGRLSGQELLGLMQLHALQSRLEHQNFYTARVHSSNVLAHLLGTIQQGASGAQVDGTAVPVKSRFVVVVGHDTQLSELAGLLHISWLMPGYQIDDAPPGGALVFEVHAPTGGQPFVRLFFTAQSMDQMRDGNGSAPSRVPVYVPGCPDLDCPVATFSKIVAGAIDPAFVAPWRR